MGVCRVNTNDYRVKAIKDDWERIRKQFLAHAEDFNNLKMVLTKIEGGYILLDTHKEWEFKITQDGVEQLSERPDSSSAYWAHSFMEAWMAYPKRGK